MGNGTSAEKQHQLEDPTSPKPFDDINETQTPSSAATSTQQQNKLAAQRSRRRSAFLKNVFASSQDSSTKDIRHIANLDKMMHSSSKDVLGDCLTACDVLLARIKSHDALSTLVNTVQQVKAALSEMKDKDIRYKTFVKNMNKSEDLLQMFSGLRDHIVLIAKMMNKCLEENKQALSSSVTSFALPQDSGIEDLSNVNKSEYFYIKEEAQILMAHHMKELNLLRNFILEVREDEKQESVQTPQADISPDTHLPTSLRGNAALELPELMPQTTSQEAVLNKKNFLHTDKEAAKFWSQNFGGKTFAVNKENFLTSMKGHAFPLFHVGWRDEMELVVDPTSDNVVSLADFKTFLEWFGPFKESTKNVESVLSLPFFWGSLSGIQAQSLLENEVQGTYVARFNETVPGTFLVSCVQDSVMSSDQSSHQFDTNSFWASQASHPTQVFHFLVKHKNGGYVFTDDEQVQHKTVTSLLDQYNLTFRKPFSDQSKKREPIDRLKKLVTDDNDEAMLESMMDRFEERKKKNAKEAIDSEVEAASILMLKGSYRERATFPIFRGRFVKPASATTTTTTAQAKPVNPFEALAANAVTSNNTTTTTTTTLPNTPAKKEMSTANLFESLAARVANKNTPATPVAPTTPAEPATKVENLFEKLAAKVQQDQQKANNPFEQLAAKMQQVKKEEAAKPQPQQPEPKTQETKKDEPLKMANDSAQQQAAVQQTTTTTPLPVVIPKLNFSFATPVKQQQQPAQETVVISPETKNTEQNHLLQVLDV